MTGATITTDDNPDLYVAMLMPELDGSGNPVVLGVYSTEIGAQARCWQCLQRLSTNRPTAVFRRPLDLDNEGEPDNQTDYPAVEVES